MTDTSAEPTPAPALRLRDSELRTLVLAKYYLLTADEHLRFDREAATFLAVNLLQEAVECTLIAVTNHLELNIQERSTTSALYDAAMTKLPIDALPGKPRINELNRIRVAAKHAAILPDRTRVIKLAPQIREFIVNAVRSVFGLDFESLSVLDSLQAGEATIYLREAEAQIARGLLSDALVSVRKAMYVTFEANSNIHAYLDPSYNPGFLFFSEASEAPAFARSLDYIRKNVTKPFDYIVLDHSELESRLLKDGIDPSLFWNIWRATPRLFRKENGDWLILRKAEFEDDVSVQVTTQVFDMCVELLLLRQRARERVRLRHNDRSWYVQKHSKPIPVHQKADKQSEVVGEIPAEWDRIDVEEGLVGFDGKEYWSILQKVSDKYLHGYVCNEDLNGDLTSTPRLP